MPSSARRARPARLLASVILAAAGAAAITQFSVAQEVAPLSSGGDDLSVLIASASTDDARFEAAKRLVVKTDERTGTAISAALRNGSAPATQRAIARAILAVDPGSPRYATALREALATASTPACVADVLAALSKAPTRVSVAAAVARFQDEQTPADIKALLSNALVSWTGCDECAARGGAGWQAWWAEAQTLDTDGWNMELVKNFRARADRLAKANESLTGSVLELYNALFAATPPEQRSAVIAAMLRDNNRQANQLGLDLASRTLLNAQPLGPTVSDAALGLLASDEEDLRASAARLVENLGAPMGQSDIAQALEREESPRVAAPLLRLLSRDAGKIPIATVLRWLRAPEPAGSAAAEAVLALHAAGVLDETASRDALSTILAIDPATMASAQSRVLAALGGQEDRAAIRAVALRSTSTGARRNAGIALAADRDETVFLLDAAAKDPALFDGAAHAVARYRASASGFLQLMSVAPREGAWVGPAARALMALPSDQRLIALRAVQDLAARDELLTAALQALAGANAAEARELNLLQAETRLDRSDGEGALASANAALHDADGHPARAERARFFALVMLGRLNDALMVTPGDPTEYWLDALRRCRTLKHANDVLALVDEHFASSMTSDQRGALRDLRAELGGHGNPERAAPPATSPSENAQPKPGSAPNQDANSGPGSAAP